MGSESGSKNSGEKADQHGAATIMASQLDQVSQ
jgi:hypothetical protein